MIRPVPLTAEMIEGFAGAFLSPRYDQPVETPAFHREGWALYCSPVSAAELIAPREHAKSTGFTFVYILAETCFRNSDYCVLIGSTEESAGEQLSNIREELLENEDLRAEFMIDHLEKDSATDIIVVCNDGHRFRVLARGAEQRIRGRLWKGKRPNLVVCDDMEDDEQVENKDRRAKFRRWFFRAAKQALGRGGRIRVHGTILHEDSLLSRLRRNSQWKHLFYKAHNAFDDFTGLLWPAAWPAARLRSRRQEFIDDGDSAGYSQEFLNDPQDNSEAYLRRGDFLSIPDTDRERPRQYGAAADFAVSKLDAANRTCFVVGGKGTNNIIDVVDCRVGRWASLEVDAEGQKLGWIMEMFSIQQRFNPDWFWVEDGVIWKSIKHMVYNEMREQDCWMNIIEVPSIKDKATRGRVYQKRHRSGGIRFDKQAEWYPGFESENLRFTGNSQATLDDQFDAASLLCRGFELHTDRPETEDFIPDEEREILGRARSRRDSAGDGRSQVTGY